LADPERSAPYPALRLEPQIGLIPLGRDRESGLFEFSHLASGEPAARDAATGRLAFGAASGVVLVLLPGGVFRMGADRSGDGENAHNVDPAADEDESPAHEVELAPFLLSKYELTQGQWQRATGRAPQEIAVESEDPLVLPVEHLTWQEAALAMDRLGLALPTEAQWEYAARAGTETPWWTGAGAASLSGAENLSDLAVRRAVEETGYELRVPIDESLDDGWAFAAPVGSLRPNPFGLYDVLGNVRELCRDLYGDYEESPARPGDGLREPAERARRATRGGDDNAMPVDARATGRWRAEPDSRQASAGVRPARALDP
jgi:formylglycine-generating enzyme required for sulfatase activity